MSDHLTAAIVAKQKLESVSGWMEYFRERVDALTDNLISQDNEQTRGAIKELRRLIELPQDLQAEVERESAALSDSDAVS